MKLSVGFAGLGMTARPPLPPGPPDLRSGLGKEDFAAVLKVLEGPA